MDKNQLVGIVVFTTWSNIKADYSVMVRGWRNGHPIHWSLPIADSAIPLTEGISVLFEIVQTPVGENHEDIITNSSAKVLSISEFKEEPDYKKILELYVRLVWHRVGDIFIPPNYNDSDFIQQNFTKAEYISLKEIQSQI